MNEELVLMIAATLLIIWATLKVIRNLLYFTAYGVWLGVMFGSLYPYILFLKSITDNLYHIIFGLIVGMFIYPACLFYMGKAGDNVLQAIKEIQEDNKYKGLEKEIQKKKIDKRKEEEKRLKEVDEYKQQFEQLERL